MLNTTLLLERPPNLSLPPLPSTLNIGNTLPHLPFDLSFNLPFTRCFFHRPAMPWAVK
jgi:hypothetical protein